MTVRYYLTADAIGGSAGGDDQSKWIDILSWVVDAGGPEFRPEIGAITVDFTNDTALTDMLDRHWDGIDLNALTIVGVNETAESTFEIERLRLADVAITSVSDKSDGGFSATFEARQYGFQSIEPVQGTSGSNTTNFAWDQIDRKSISFDSIPDAKSAVADPPIVPAEGVQYYIGFNEFSGDATDLGFEGWTRLTSFEHGSSRASDGADGTGRLSFDPITISLDTTALNSGLLDTLAKGALLEGAEIIGTTRDDKGTVVSVFEMSLSDVLVSAFDSDSTGNQTAAVEWSRMSIETADRNGVKSETVAFVDLVDSKARETDVFDATPNDSSGTFSSGDNRYFLFIDGLAGSVRQQGLEGWHEVEAAAFGASATFDQSHNTTFKSLGLTLKDDAGLTALMSADVSQAQFKSATLIETKENDTEGLLIMSSVAMTDVRVSDVVDTTGSGVQLALDGQAIQTAYTQRDPTSGALIDTQVFGWNISTGKPVTFDDDAGKAQAAASFVFDEDIEYYINITGLGGAHTVLDQGGLVKLSEFELSVNDVPNSKGISADATFQLEAGDALIGLGEATTSRTVFEGATVFGYSRVGSFGGNETQLAYEYKLENVFVTNYETSGAQAVVTVGFSDFGVQTTGIDTNGDQQRPTSYAYNLTKQSAVSFDTLDAPLSKEVFEAASPTQYFMEIDGLAGGSQTDGFATSFEIKSWSQSQKFDPTQTTVGAGLTVDPLTVTSATLDGFSDLMHAVGDNRIIDALRIDGVRTIVFDDTPDTQVIQQFKLQEVQVIDVTLDGQGGYTAQFIADTVGMEVKSIQQDGKLLQTSDYAYQIATGKPVLFQSMDAARGETGARAVTTDQTSFFLKLDGIDGDATAPGYEGWFSMDDLAFGVSTEGTAGGPRSAAIVDEINVDINSFYADPALMQALMTGQVFGSAQIHGVASGGGASDLLVMDIDLTGARIADIKIPDIIGEVKATISFGQIEMQSYGLDQDGQLVDNGWFGYDLVKNISIEQPDPGLPITDTNSAANTVLENARIGTEVNLVAQWEPGAQWSLSDDAGGRFAIDERTGVVTVAGALDRETDGPSAFITIEARDGAGGFQSGQFAIQIGDVDEFDVTLPEDVDPAANVVSENAAIGTLVGITAFSDDADATTNAVSYVLSGADAGLFEINGKTGVVTTATSIDFETLGATVAFSIVAVGLDGSKAIESFKVSILDETGQAFVGDAKGNLLLGTSENDTAFGYRGNDRIEMLDGDDYINAGSNNDRVNAGTGDDTVLGGFGKDYAVLGDGDDYYGDTAQTGTNGIDTVFGGRGDDEIRTGGGDDIAFGGNQDDLLILDAGNDKGFGGNGADVLRMGDGNDFANGGAGRDRLETGAGHDTAVGGAGSDTAYLSLGNDVWLDDGDTQGDDRVFGGAGMDEIQMLRGDDTATGGADADTFVLGSRIDADVITDFEVGLDTLRISDALWTDPFDVAALKDYAVDDTGGILLQFTDTDSVRLEGVMTIDGLLADIILF